MTYLFVAFSGRNTAYRAFEILRETGVACAIISTPSSANVGCGLSIKFNENSLNKVRGVLRGVSNHYGMFRATQIGGKILVTRL